MDDLPDAVVQYILSHIRSARDVTSCKCVSKRFNESMPFIRSLYFPRNSFDGSCLDPETIITQMITSVIQLEELIIYCPFSVKFLASWLIDKNRFLRHLELRMDDLSQITPPVNTLTKIDCLNYAKNIETLKIWGVQILRSPNWSVFYKLKSLEIVGGRLKDAAVSDALEFCPNLTNLALLGCEGAKSINIKLQRLECCRLDFYGMGDCCLSMSAPNLQELEVQGCGWVRVLQNHCLRKITISNTAGRVSEIDFGKLPALEFLSIRGVQWCWNAVSSILECASEVRHLFMKIEFCGGFNNLQPFPEIGLVEFLNNHPKLQTFEIHGAMFAALCQRNSLKNVDSGFIIPCLEQVVVTVRSPLNAELKIRTLETLITYSRKLRKMVIRASQMKNCDHSGDDFFEDLYRLKFLNHRIVQIE